MADPGAPQCPPATRAPGCFNGTLARCLSPRVIVRSSPQGGFRWRVILDGETVGSGDAPTEFEAREAAEETVERIEAKPPEAP